MQVIIDANVIIAMLIRPGKPIDLFFDGRLKVLAPQLLFEELKNNKEELMEKSNLTGEEYEWLLTILTHNIEIIPELDFLSYKETANKICPDPKDIVYFALALYLKYPIWTNEKVLKEQTEVTIYATPELIRVFEIN